MLMNTGENVVTSKRGLITTIAASTGGKVQYALEGSVFVAGAAIQWLRDEMRMIRTSAQSEEYCRAVPDTAGVYIVPAFSGLGAPYWNQYARGTVVGLTRGVSKDHFIRAAVESLAYQTNDLAEAMKNDSGISINALNVDGGASANNFLMQFQSDISNMKIQRPSCVETTALGAAYLAGLGAGFWCDKEEIKKNRRMEREFTQQISEDERKKLLSGWRRAVKCAEFWANEEKDDE